GQCFATLALTPPATSDNCGVASVTKNYPSNNFPIGETVVTWTVLDIHGLTSVTEQVITVTDAEAPVVVAPSDITVNNDPGLCTATVALVAPTASDNCGVANITNDHPSTTFAIGTTVVTWTITFNQG